MTFKESMKELLRQYGIIKEKDHKISYEVVYEPDTKDAHGHWMSPQELEKACSNFNENLEAGVIKSNLFHIQDTDLFSIESTWIHKELDVIVAESGEPIKAGTWVAKLKYHDDDLWELKKAGVIGGVSFSGIGILNEETGEITNLRFDGG